MRNPRSHLLRGHEIGLYLSIPPYIRKISTRKATFLISLSSYSRFRCNTQVFVFLILDKFSNSLIVSTNGSDYRS